MHITPLQIAHSTALWPTGMSAPTHPRIQEGGLGKPAPLEALPMGLAKGPSLYRFPLVGLTAQRPRFCPQQGSWVRGEAV